MMRTSTLAAILTSTLFLAGCGQQSAPAPGPSPAPATTSPAQPTPPPASPAAANAQEALWMAVAMGEVGDVKQELDKGTDVNLQEPLSGSTLLMSAAFLGNTEVAKLLVERGADLEKRNNDGSTPLLTAAFMCRPEIAEFLIQKGAEINITNKAGSTPLDTVSGEWGPAVKGIYEFVGSVTQYPMDLERIETERPKMVELLKKHGAKSAQELK